MLYTHLAWPSLQVIYLPYTHRNKNKDHYPLLFPHTLRARLVPKLKYNPLLFSKVCSSSRRYDIVELKYPKWPTLEFK